MYLSEMASVIFRNSAITAKGVIAEQMISEGEVYHLKIDVDEIEYTDNTHDINTFYGDMIIGFRDRIVYGRTVEIHYPKMEINLENVPYLGMDRRLPASAYFTNLEVAYVVTNYIYTEDVVTGFHDRVEMEIEEQRNKIEEHDMTIDDQYFKI